MSLLPSGYEAQYGLQREVGLGIDCQKRLYLWRLHEKNKIAFGEGQQKYMTRNGVLDFGRCLHEGRP